MSSATAKAASSQDQISAAPPILADEIALGQWHLGLMGSIDKVWADYDGRGVTVGLYDTGIQYSHWDLDANYNDALHITVAGKTYDGEYRPASGGRGTSLAGLIAAENNGLGTVGIAYGTSITGVNMLDPYSGGGRDPGIWINAPTRTLFTEALRQRATMDIAVDGWGRTTPDFASASSRGVAGTDASRFAAAFEYAAEAGRGGLGTISLNGSGNTGRDAQADSAFTSRHTITVGGYRQGDGYSVTTSGRGSSLLVSAPSGDVNGAALTSTDLLGRFGNNLEQDPGGNHDVTDRLVGTTTAAASTAGVVALMLDANPDLGWRDVSDILASSATLPIDWNDRVRTVPVALADGSVADVSANDSFFVVAGRSGANWNGGGMHYSTDYGYGAVNAHAAVRMAEVASVIGAPKTSGNEVSATSGVMAVGLVAAQNPIDPEFFGNDFTGQPTQFAFEMGEAVDLEHVDLTLTYTHVFFDSSDSLWTTKIKLTAPDGTVAFVDTQLSPNLSVEGDQSFTFGFASFRGVESAGTWLLEFETAGPYTVTEIKTAKVDFYGSAPSADDVHVYTDEYLTMVQVDPQGGRRLLSDINGGSDWINAAAVTGNMNLSLVAGARTTIDGVAAFTITRASEIENAVTGDGNDTITGNAADNILYGMRGDDVLNGGQGNDTLAGGVGADIFRFDAGSGKDRILDWESGDFIDTVYAVAGADDAGNVTLGADGLLRLGADGDQIELVGQAGAVLKWIGLTDGYNRYAWVSGNAVDRNLVMQIAPVTATTAVTDGGDDPAAANRPVADHATGADGPADMVRLATLGVAVDQLALDSMGRPIAGASTDPKPLYTTWGPETLSGGRAVAATARTAAATYPAPTSVSDPLAAEQWHLRKLGDMDAIWADYTGRGVKVGVYDSGIEYAHEDLAANYDPSLHVVVNGKTYDGDFRPLAGGHGTSVAGLIAAARNGVGTVGVAYDASLTGVNIFDPYSGGGLDEGLYVNAADLSPFYSAMRQSARFDVVNHSWGRAYPGYLSSDSRGVTGTHAYEVANAFTYAATVGRGGLGTISVVAAGNNSIDFQGDGAQTIRHAIAVGAYRELDGLSSNYSSRGHGLLVSAPSNDLRIIGGTGVVSTDLTWREGYNRENDPGGDHDYTDQFGGTSAATPIVSGVMALMLDANPGLGWRDVQKIVASSSTMPVPFEDRTRLLTYTDESGQQGQARMNEGWFSVVGSATDWNGGGRHYSPDYGYGAIDARAAVRMAEVWSLFGPAQTSANEVSFSSETFDSNLKPVPLGSVDRDDSYTRFTGTPASYSFEVKGADMAVEQVDMTISYTATLDFGDGEPYEFTLNSPVKIALVAPDGTEAFMDLLPTSSGGAYSADTQNYTFGFRTFMGAEANGLWTLKAESSFNTVLTIQTVKLDLYGGRADSDDVHTYTDEFFTMAAIAGQDGRRMLTDTNGGTDWINAAALSSDVELSLVERATTRFGGRDAFTLAAGSRIENAVTGDGNDRLIGNALDNTLYGMRGNDWLNGGAGDDKLFGGAGSDVFAFDTQGVSGRDTILDWSQGDRIATSKQLRGADVSGQLTLGSSALVLLDNTTRGDTVELAGKSGAVLLALGKSDGYWWYGFLSDADDDFVDGHVAEAAPDATGGFQLHVASAPTTASSIEGSAQTDAFFLYNVMGEGMASGAQVYA